jgi:hypothetical protein
MTSPRLILCACLLVVALALGANAYSLWLKPAAMPKTPANPALTCPHALVCPFCRGWDAFTAGNSVSDNPFPAPSIPDDPTSPWTRWKSGWEAGQRNSQMAKPEAPLVADVDPQAPIIRKHTAQIEDLQAWQRQAADRLDKLDPPPGKDKLPGQ